MTILKLAVALPAEVRKNTFVKDLRGHWRYKASIESILSLFNIVAYHLEKAKNSVSYSCAQFLKHGISRITVAPTF
jgi:hypothetical protein